MRKRPIIFAGMALLAGIVWLGTPARIDTVVTSEPDLENGPDDWITAQHKISDAAYGVVPGAEQRIVWQEHGRRTEYAVVYLHGFSATRQEIAPVPERVAEQLGANLFEARLDGHGLETERLKNVSAENWILDANAALAIGSALGEKIVLISTSTGGSLSLAMLGYANMSKVDTLVMVSPNIEPADPKAQWLTRPGGALLGWLATGGERRWQAYNDLQERFWTTTVPTAANVEVMRLLDYANQKWPARIEQDLLMIISPHDQVVSPHAARDAFAGLDAPRKRLVEIAEFGKAGNHVIAGDILWPENNQRFVAEIVGFVRGATSPPRISTAPE